MDHDRDLNADTFYRDARMSVSLQKRRSNLILLCASKLKRNYVHLSLCFCAVAFLDTVRVVVFVYLEGLEEEFPLP